MRRFLIPLLLVFLLTSCRLPSLIPQIAGHAFREGAAPAHAGQVLKGRYEAPRSVMATPQDIANGATLALIDAESGATVATTVSDAEGNFVMIFGEGVSFVHDRAYYLDVYKGVRLDPADSSAPFNQAGADTLRLRNILFYQEATMAGPAGWKNLLDGTTSNVVYVSNRSTTLSIAIALKQQAGETVVLSDFIGALAADIENDPAWTLGGVTQKAYVDLKAIVVEAIASDRDPLQYVVYDENLGSFMNPWVGFSVSSVTPDEGPINQIITITGDGFDLGDPTVAINGRQAQILTRTAQVITAKVLPGSRTGPVSVQIGTTLQAGTTFKVNFQDGHSALLDRVVGGQTVRMLYAANPSWNTVVQISPDGTITKLWDDVTIPDLKTPRQVAVWNQKLYVSCDPSGTASDKILELDPANPASVRVHSTAVPHPYGLAFDLDGNLHVSSYQAGGSVIKLNALGANVAQYAGLTSPRGLAFDYQGNLFVAEETGRVVKLTAPAMTAETWGNLPSPLGLAVDSAGDVFVASNTNDVIYRITSLRAMSVFAMLNKPGGLTIDEKGYLYVSDTGKNLVRRISPSGDAKVYAYGISDPRGLAVDPVDGTLYVSLNTSNAILKVENGALKPFVTGIANPMSISFRGKGILIAHPDTHTVSFAERSGKLTTLATGLEYPGGADQAVDGGGNLTGPLYVPRFGDLEAGNTARMPRYDSYALSDGAYSGVDVIDGATRTLRRWLYRQQITYLAVDAGHNLYVVHTGDRTLTKISWRADEPGGNTSRQITRLCGPSSPYTFGATPGWVSLDKDENVYVVVPGENKIYRFVKALNYQKEEITGFSSPWGIAFSDTTPQAMFVSNTGDGKIRKVATPATDTTPLPTATFEIAVPTSVKGLAYMATGTPGTGTLYMANGNRVEKAGITGNAYAAGTYANYFDALPVSWSYLHAKASTGELFGWGSATYAHRLAPGTPPVAYAYLDYSGWSRLRGITFTPDFGTLYRSEEQYGGLTSMSAINTTREVLLAGDTLYVASPDTFSGGGILRINLTTNEERYIALQTYSLALHGTNLYAGHTNGRIYKVDTAGKHTEVWNLGVAPYGLDIRGDTVWAVGSNAIIYERPIPGGTNKDHKYGMMGPVF